jgi:hypothetical protein
VLNAIAKPNIESVVAEFLNDPAAAQYETGEDKRGGLELFLESMNSYGHQFLTAEELKILDRYESLDDNERLDFSQVFGPDEIPQNVSLFVGYYVIA